MKVREATAAEIEQRSRLTASVWGNRLTVEQYLERERVLADTAFAKRALRTWVLEGDGGEILASCETYRMTSELGGERGWTHGFASVFVEPRLRGKGLAKDMIGRVLALLREEGAHAAHLFSEVGTSLYGRLGFLARPILARRWSATKDDIAGAFTREQSRDALGDRLAAGAEDGASYRIVLDHDQLDWHRVRANAYHRFLAADRPPPDSLAGAIAGRAWITWFADYRLDKLLVLAVRPGDREESAALVEATRRAASALGFAFAESWESPATRLPGGEEHALDDEIPMILPFAIGLEAADWREYGRGCWI